ncbi:hypothetical protein ABZ468_07640 [Streptomyces sp. NPDC005708]|uniref:hypothetical protein n=1 Tax=Streptomyces sp. NPDC005708 TaxID=3154564 RepID=UPI0033F40A77
MNLLAIHTSTVDTGECPPGCTCPRAACGAAESGPGIPAGCTAHGTIRAQHHHAFDCPALPADTDLTRLWILVTKWTENGPVLLRAYTFDRVFLADLRGSSTLWAVSEGDTAEAAAEAWRARVDEMRADVAARQAADLAAAEKRRQARLLAEAVLHTSGRRAALRILAGPES